VLQLPAQQPVAAEADAQKHIAYVSWKFGTGSICVGCLTKRPTFWIVLSYKPENIDNRGWQPLTKIGAMNLSDQSIESLRGRVRIFARVQARAAYVRFWG
jgi:hypothetical protein